MIYDNSKEITGQIHSTSFHNLSVIFRFLGSLKVTKVQNHCIPTINNGKVTVDKTEAAKGQTVTLTVEPAEGYELKSLTVNGTEVTLPPYTVIVFE